VLAEVLLGEFLPDLAASKSNHLTVANNVRAIANGYGPVGAFQAVTSALSGAFVGGGAFVASDGNATLVAATADDLQKYSGSWSTVTSLATTQRWQFAQFGDNALFANGGTIGALDLIAGTVSTPTDAPVANDVFRVRDFVMALTDTNTAQWCQFNNSSVWTTGVNQADFQPILGGQAVRGLGGEDALILRKNGIDLVTYVGGDLVFQFDEISAEIGCMAAGSVAQVGKAAFFLSERGFMMCDRQTVTPIADEKFNRWFFDTYPRAQIDEMWAAIDPRNSLVLWGMPGTPGRIIAYNWVLKRASVIQINFTAIFSAFTANVSIEAVDALYPGGLEAIPISLDDASLSGGNPLLLIVDDANTLGALAGSALEATVQMQNVEPSKGRRSRIRNMRPVTDATSASAVISAKLRAGDGQANVTSGAMRDNGKLPIRANGRFNDITLTIPAGEDWTYLQGFELEFEAGDGR
jgi:hypothetical protein